MSKLAVFALAALVCLSSCDSEVPAKREHGLFGNCCSGAGTCVPRTSVNDSDADRLGQDTCDTSLLCAPSGLAESPKYVAKSCRSFGQREGRCLPSCLPEVSAHESELQRDGCDAPNLCVPCYDPVTGERNGACNLGSDLGPAEASNPFAQCCSERGRCVPASIVQGDVRDHLEVETCDPDTQSVCVPDLWVKDRTAKPKTCRGYDNAEGRCLDECLPEVSERRSQLRADGCDPGQKCVPCYDPVSGDPLDACRIGDDAPQEPAVVFDRCCNDSGSCVPMDAIDPDDRGRVAADSCKKDQALCVPRDWLALGRKPPPTCRAYGNAEGRCLSRCLPEVAEQSDRLRQDGCEGTQLCVPCFDTVTGEQTPACTTTSDPGPQEPAVLFVSCCDGASRCVPQEAIDPDERGRLSSEGCEGSAASLCVPQPWITNPPTAAKSCRAYDNAEGRCLPSCLPEVQSHLGRLRQDSCAANERCAPCYDPVTGEKTSACALPGDTGPKEPVHLFANCCGDIGRCVPSPAVDPADRTRLDADSCRGNDALCAPKTWITDEEAVAASCRAYGDAEGRCLPSCLPDVKNRMDKLRQDTCSAAFMCVPCFDPVTGENTHACEVGGDRGPREPPLEFGSCCGGIGRCVPTPLIDQSERGRLDKNTCEPGDDALCVPGAWVENEHFIPGSCVAPGEIEGRCLPQCLPDVALRRDQLSAAGCAAQHLCVPCYDPVTGEDTHSCNVGTDKPQGPAKLFPNCCGDVGVCVPGSQVSAGDRGRLGADSCDPASQALCAPRTWVGMARRAPKSCTGYNAAEGRCLPTCLPEVASKAAQLRQDVCTVNELCTPCYDPVDGSDTQACHIAGDSGPKQAPQLFANCCSDLGRCLPPELVSVADRSHLAADSCSSNQLCAPSDWLDDTRKAPPTCHGLLAAEGRCLPQCLPDVAAQGNRLLQDTCAPHNACAPCFDPVTGNETAACQQTGDTGPTENPKVFQTCCHSAGRCVPNSAVDDGDRGRLSPDKCQSPVGSLCVPTEWLESDRQPPASCRAPGDIEGRCLMSCLPDVAKRKDDLRQSTCGNEQLCVPCYDPLTGNATSACNVNGDAPKEAPKRYGSCCSNTGTCMPSDLVNGKSSLNVDVCTDPDALCVPREGPLNIDPHFAACNSSFGRGACVSTCFINPSRGRYLDRDRCAGSQLCVPCGSLDLKTAVCE